MDLFTTNSICVTVCLHLDWRDRGPVFHLWGWMVCYRWSFQNLLHQNMQRLGEAEADGVFAGGRNVNIRLTLQHDLMVMTFFLFLSIRLFSHMIIRAHHHPSTRSSESICLSNWIRQRCAKLIQQHPTQTPILLLLSNPICFGPL